MGLIPQPPFIVTLDTVAITRVPFLARGVTVDYFDGAPGTVFLQESEDPTSTLARDTVRTKKQRRWYRDVWLYIVNTQAQPGKRLELAILGPGGEQVAGIQAGQISDALGNLINPATEENQESLLDAFGVREEDPVPYTLLDRLRGINSNQGALVWGTKTAPTATAEAIAASQAVPQGIGVVVKAHPSNTDVVYVVGSGGTTANGLPLSASESVTLYPININQIYVIGDAAGQIARYIVEVSP